MCNKTQNVRNAPSGPGTHTCDASYKRVLQHKHRGCSDSRSAARGFEKNSLSSKLFISNQLHLSLLPATCSL